VVGGGTRDGGGSKESCVLELLLGFKGGTFRPAISPESDFFIAVKQIKANKRRTNCEIKHLHPY